MSQAMTHPTIADILDPSAAYRVMAKCLGLLRPEDELTPSEFTERYMQIPGDNARPGPVNFENAPYQVEPLDMAEDPDCYRVTLKWGAQMGKTFIATALEAYYIRWRPANQIMMQPTQDDMRTWLNVKWEGMVESCPEVKKRLSKPRGRDGVNNQKQKDYLGGHIMFVWSGSATSLRGKSAPKIFTDEVDGYDMISEGDQRRLLWKRATTYGDEKLLFETSTPTAKGDSAIDDAFESGDKRRWHCKCPHCGHEQFLVWENVLFERDNDGDAIPDTVGYACDGCGVAWSDSERIEASKNGRWIAEKPFKGHASFHVNAIASPMISLVDLVRDFIDSERENSIQTFVNTVLAEVYEETADKMNVEMIKGKDPDDDFKTVPGGVLFITAGADIQHDRIEVEVVGWGADFESYSLDYQVIWGDTSIQAGRPNSPWDDLAELKKTFYRSVLGEELPIKYMGVDSSDGGRTDQVYEFCAKHAARRIYAVKGFYGFNRAIIASPSRKSYGKNKRPVDLYPVGVDAAKLDTLRALQKDAPGPMFCHFPCDRDEEYFKGLAESEKLKRYYQAGKLKFRWVHDKNIRNEPLDCRVYAYAMAKLTRPNWTRLKAKRKKFIMERLAAIVGGNSAKDPETKRAQTEKKPRTSRKRQKKKSFMNNF